MAEGLMAVLLFAIDSASMVRIATIWKTLVNYNLW